MKEQRETMFIVRVESLLHSVNITTIKSRMRQDRGKQCIAEVVFTSQDRAGLIDRQGRYEDGRNQLPRDMLGAE